METLYSQADSLSAHEAIACVCESKEWWKSGEYYPTYLFVSHGVFKYYINKPFNI